MPGYQHATVRSFVRRVDEGELFLPTIQRDIVWSRDQILFLIDSLLRRYPIGTLLIWRTTMEVRARRFVAKFRPGMRLSDLEVAAAAVRRDYVLDGQQRLQALYIALFGSHDGETVYLDLLSKPEAAAEFELRYGLFFAKEGAASIPLTAVPLRELVTTDVEPMEAIRTQLRRIRDRGRELASDEENSIQDIVSRVQSVFTQQEVLSYFLADAVEQPQFRDLDEVLEVFIRVNSGGTKLDISDLLFAVVKTEWLDAQEQFEILLEELNAGGLFAFDKDDLLRICLLLTGHGAAYELSKLRGAAGDDLIRLVRANWLDIQRTIRQALDFTVQRTQIRNQRVLRSKNALLPLMDYLHKVNSKKAKIDDEDRLAMQRWLYRVLLERQFGGQSVTLLNRCHEVIASTPGEEFPEVELLRALRLSQVLTSDTILDRGRGTTQESVLPVYVAYLQAGLGMPQFAPRYSGNAPEVDHIVPQSWLRKRYKADGIDPPDELINNVGNYRLLEKDENRDKSDQLPDEYYDGPEANALFRARHFIPLEVPLGPTLTIPAYEQFVKERRKVIFERIREVLRPPDQMPSDPPRGDREGQLWTRDEIVLAYDLFKEHGRRPPAGPTAELAMRLGRPPGAVSLKIGNLQASETRDAKGMPQGSHLDDEVVAEYRYDLGALRRRAIELRASPVVTPTLAAVTASGHDAWLARSTRCDDCGARVVNLHKHRERRHTPAG